MCPINDLRGYPRGRSDVGPMVKKKDAVDKKLANDVER